MQNEIQLQQNCVFSEQTFAKSMINFTQVLQHEIHLQQNCVCLEQKFTKAMINFKQVLLLILGTFIMSDPTCIMHFFQSGWREFKCSLMCLKTSYFETNFSFARPGVAGAVTLTVLS